MDSRNQGNEQNTSRPVSSRRRVSVEARGGVVQLGDTNITVNAPHGLQSLPSVNVSSGDVQSDDGPDVSIQALDANVSIAERTNLMLNLTNNQNNKQDSSSPRDTPTWNVESQVRTGQTSCEFGYSTYGPEAMEHPYQSLSTKSESQAEEHPYQSLSTKAESQAEKQPCQSLQSTESDSHVEKLSGQFEKSEEESLSLDAEESIKSSGDYGASKDPEAAEMESKTEDSDGKKTSIVNLSGSDVQNGSQQSSDKSKETDSNESDQSVPIAQHSPIPGVSIKEEEKLHFCIRQDNTYVQIGQCCVIVELSVNDELVEKLKREGQLTAEVRSGQTLVTLQWRDLTEEKDYYLSKLKLIVKEKQREIQADLDAELVRSLTEEQCHNVRKIVHKIFSDIQGRLIEISEGCVVLTFHHLTLESYKKLHEITYVKHLEEYFTAELITDRMKEISANARISVRLVSNGESANRRIEPLYTTSRQSIQDSSYIADLGRNVSQLQMEISDIRGNLHSELLSFKQENSVQMTNVRDSVSEVREDLSRRLRESADALRGEIKEVIGQQSEEISLLRQQYSKTEEKKTQFEQQLASRLADILLPRLQQSLSSASSSSQTTTAELPPVPASMDRHERLSREFQTSLTTPSPGPSSGRSAPSTLDVAVASSLQTTSSLQTAPSPEKSLSDRKYEYFLKTLLDRRKSSELYEYQSSMDDDEALRRALFASKQKSDEKKEQKPTAKPGSDDTLVGWLKHNTTNDVLDCIRNSLDIAKQDSSKNQSPQASKAIATVLLLDTSESMRESQGLDEMKSLVQRFIDKTKEMGLKSGDYKENVGLVTFGSTARIIQHLTSDFCSTNHLIDKLEADGQQTSVLEGILVAISAISGKGVNLKFGPYHKVLPRIVIISDGLVTDYSQVKSDIIKGVDDQTVEKLGKFTSKMKECGIEFPVFCVPVGQKCKTVLERIGQVIPNNEADRLNMYFNIQKTIGQILKLMNEKPKEDRNAQLEKALKNLSQYDLTDKEDIRREVIEKLCKLPRLGTRVRSTKPIENSNDTGTVMQHLNKDMIMVIHDNGERHYYDWSFTQLSLAILPPTSVDNSQQTLPVGTLVVRGPHWNFGNQDGGPDEIGVVITKTKEEANNLVRVCWRSPDAKHSINVYRYGAQGQSDIKPLDILPEEDAHIQWMRQDREGRWTPLPEDLSIKIEKEAQKALVNKSSEVEIPADSQSKHSYRYKTADDKKILENIISQEKMNIKRWSTMPTQFEGIG